LVPVLPLFHARSDASSGTSDSADWLYLLDASARPTLMLVLVAALLSVAALSAFSVFDRPVYSAGAA